MEKRIFEKVLNGLYNDCGLEPVKKDEIKNKFYHIQRFIHPTQRKIIEVSYSWAGEICVLVYRDSANAYQRDCVCCKTIEQFVEAVS